MKNGAGLAGWSFCFALLPATAFAAEDSGSFLVRAWHRGPVFFAVTLAVALVFWAVLIHVAAGITKLEHRTFGRALKAAFISWILGNLLYALMMAGQSFLPTETARLACFSAVILLPGTLAIRNCYEAGFVTSLFTFLIVLVVMLVLGVVAGLALGAIGQSA